MGRLETRLPEIEIGAKTKRAYPRLPEASGSRALRHRSAFRRF